MSEHYLIIINSLYKLKKTLFFCVIILLTINSIAQDTVPKKSSDSLYREDQFYIGISYNLLTDAPKGVNSEALSGGIYFGFIRDMPINKKRTIAIGLGLGMSLDQYGNSLLIDKETSKNTTYTVLNNSADYKYNRLTTTVIEAPIEFRWRSSNPTSYKFWRAYAGFRIGYAFWHRASFKDFSKSISHSDIPELTKLRLGATVSLGYNKFNFFVYYGINPFFNDNAITTNGQQVNLKTIKLGLVFYIL